MKRSDKGFTLIELMIVVVIVAILSAVALPYMSVPKRKAMAAEAMTGIGVIQTYMRCYYAENSAYTGEMSLLIPIEDSLDGNYFFHDNYGVVLSDDGAGYTITCTGSQGYVDGMVVSIDEKGSWDIEYN